jgi:indole-3-glycerol phosphate synthase
MMNILEEIVQVKKDEVKKLRSEYHYRHFSEFDYFNRPVISMKSALKASRNIAVIAEIKKASPSAGIIRADFDHLNLAGVYQENGVAAISVLTDRQFFQGNISFLKDIAGSKTIPLLCKDFIIDEFQIFEARAHGADCVLFIAEILSANQILELTHAARETNLEVLLEVHSAGQLGKVKYSTNSLIGINNRNLENFSVDLKTTESLSELIPPEVVLVSESGIKTRDHLDRLKKTRIDGILVGEHFMRLENIGAEVQKFREWGQRAD